MKEATRRSNQWIVKIMFVKQNVIIFLYLSNDKKYQRYFTTYGAKNDKLSLYFTQKHKATYTQINTKAYSTYSIIKQ